MRTSITGYSSVVKPPASSLRCVHPFRHHARVLGIAHLARKLPDEIFADELSKALMEAPEASRLVPFFDLERLGESAGILNLPPEALRKLWKPLRLHELPAEDQTRHCLRALESGGDWWPERLPRATIEALAEQLPTERGDLSGRPLMELLR